MVMVPSECGGMTPPSPARHVAPKQSADMSAHSKKRPSAACPNRPVFKCVWHNFCFALSFFHLILGQQFPDHFFRAAQKGLGDAAGIRFFVTDLAQAVLIALINERMGVSQQQR